MTCLQATNTPKRGVPQVREAGLARQEATATLLRVVTDGALTDAWCRSLVREGADVAAIFDSTTAFDALPLREHRADVAWLSLAAPYAFARAVVASEARLGAPPGVPRRPQPSLKQCRPELLDEIDAALDESNAARVADLLRELSATCQVIAISHRVELHRAASHLVRLHKEKDYTLVCS